MNMLIEGLPETVEIGDAIIPIRYDFQTGILFEEMIQDDGMSNREKFAAILELYYPERGFSAGQVIEAAQRAIWFYRCGKDPEDNPGKSGDSSTDGVPYSFEYDAPYIYAAFMQDYGIDLTQADLHWWQFRALFDALSENTQFMKIIGYRTMKIPPKMPKEQKAFYNRMKEVYRLPVSEETRKKEEDLIDVLMNGGDPSEILKH